MDALDSHSHGPVRMATLASVGDRWTTAGDSVRWKIVDDVLTRPDRRNRSEIVGDVISLAPAFLYVCPDPRVFELALSKDAFLDALGRVLT